MEDVAVFQSCDEEIVLLVEHPRPNGITPAQEQLDGERRAVPARE